MEKIGRFKVPHNIIIEAKKLRTPLGRFVTDLRDDELTRALSNPSPAVRVAAADSLGQDGLFHILVRYGRKRRRGASTGGVHYPGMEAVRLG